MLRAAICAAALMVAPAAHAVECGSNESADIVRVVDWAATYEEHQFGDRVHLAVTLESGAAEAFRMIDASVRFRDVLGQQMAGHSVERDLSLAPGESLVDEGTYAAMGGIHRLPDINPEDVQVIACTESVVYADGTVERFDE